MISLKSIKNIFFIPELVRKLLFTVTVLIVYSIGKFIPIIGVDVPLLVEHMKNMTGALGGFLRYVDIFSGGALQQCTLFALGVGPYITASIMMQILSMSIPYFEQLAKEGEYGKKQINQYTRYLALGLSIMYSIMYSTYIEYNHLFISPGFGAKMLFILSLTVGSMFTMWLGEQISLMGLGSGSSLIIFTGIVAHFPTYVAQTINWVQVGNMNPIVALLILAFFIAVTACIVFLEKGDRKIPVQYARRIIGQRIYGGQNTYIPFKINNVGVMPIIFASSVLNLPYFVLSFLAQRYEILKGVVELFKVNGFLYNVFEFGLIMFFTFLYLTLVYNPVEIANDMKKQGGFIPGLRPGQQTADYFDYILTRIGLIGAFYLATLALLPNILRAFVAMPFSLQGTSLLISVGVALEISALIESYLIEHNYGSFIKGGRLKSGVVR
ncbi:MAG: preprotein translocase subunit SecY [Candidatus Babeliaceae bacterium]